MIKLAWNWFTGNLQLVAICAALIAVAFVAGYIKGGWDKADSLTNKATAETIDTKGKQDEVGNNRPDALPLAGVLRRGDL